MFSLAVSFTALLKSPGFLSGRATVGSDISYIFAVVFTALFIVSGYFARKKQGLKHHRMMLVSMGVMFLYFTYYYLVRRLGVSSLEDQLGYPGSEWEYEMVFRPILILHFIVVTLSSFFAIYMIISGLSAGVRNGGSMTLKNEKAAVSKVLWGISLVWLGVLVWFVFFFHEFGLAHKIAFLVVAYFLPAGMAVFINRRFPYKDARHRALGKVCIILFAVLLATSTLTYFMLYIK